MTRIVIQTCLGYEAPVKKLLRSIHFHEQAHRFIIVVNNCDREKIHKRNWEDEAGTSAAVATIETPRNLWEYVSFEKIGDYMRHPMFKAKLYFFLHDTCFVYRANRFWKHLDRMSDKLSSDPHPNSILFPGIRSEHHNILLAKPQFVKEFGAQFKGRVFTKADGIRIEHSMGPVQDIKGNREWPHTYAGRRAILRPPGAQYSDVERHTKIYPSLCLHKYYHHVNIEDDNSIHPDKP